jgi:predicted dehydrogenase
MNRSIRIGIVGAGANTRAMHIPGLRRTSDVPAVTGYRWREGQ